MSAHAKLSPSSSAMWMNCPGSIAAQEAADRDVAVKVLNEAGVIYGNDPLAVMKSLVKGGAIADPSDSEYSVLGRTAHDYAEQVLRAILDNGPSAPPMPAELDRGAIAEYVYHCIDLAAGCGLNRKVWIEAQVDFSAWVPGGFGTADFICLDRGTGELWVRDLKYGQGVEVYAFENTQMLLYAIGAAELVAFTEGIEVKIVNVGICQPRRGHFDEWALPASELFDVWAPRFKSASAAALAPNAPRVPGAKQCQWCRAKATPHCPEIAKAALTAALDGFDVEPDAKPKVVKAALQARTDEADLAQLAAWLDSVALVNLWAAAVKDRATALVFAGETLPGWKLVQGRSTRAYRDKDAAYARIRSSRYIKNEDAFDLVLKSPAQIGKILGDDHPLMVELVHKPPGKPALVPETDPRPAVIAAALDGFNNLTGDDDEA